MHVGFLGLGSNQGARLAHLQQGINGLHRSQGLRGTAVSPVYETEAHTIDPEATQRPFLNAVLQVETERTPEAVLHRAQQVERNEGRPPAAQRDRWAPRSLDVDLLAIDGLTSATHHLTLPHPRLAERMFVLRPWADLAPNFGVPAPFEATVRTLLARCTDAGAVRRTPYLLTLPSDVRP
jgi:2-amino-4-hydroxy-6-hydroxymethyldihydropteridine diphosphokinase